MILLIDNYDSFTYNLYQYLRELGAEVVVQRNDAITVAEAMALEPDGVVISPGPCTPDDAGISIELVRAFAGVAPVLGVCLGHQAIGRAFGGRVVAAPKLMHGKVSSISHEGEGIFSELASPFTATRYHSLIVEEASLPDELEITARSEDGVIMGLRHREYDVIGLQFHPESILTSVGHDLLANFLNICDEHEQHEAAAAATSRELKVVA